MRKLVLILIASIAAMTFIRAYDNTGGINDVELQSGKAVQVVAPEIVN